MQNKADIRTVFFVLFYLSWQITSWFLFQPKWYIAMPLILVNCVLSFICAVIIHNTIHVPIFKSKLLNRIFQLLLTFSHGHPVSGFVPGHNLSHHRYLGTDKDAARPEKVQFSLNFLNQLLFFFVISGSIARDERKFVKKMYKHYPGWAFQYLLEFGLTFSIKVALLFIDWQRALLLIWLPHFFSTWGILGTNYWQHDGCDSSHEYNHSRNFVGKIFNWLVFNNGYHAAHHNNPGIHWSELPAYHEKHIAPFNHPNLNQTNFLIYLIKTHILPGKRVDFEGNEIKKMPKRPDGDWVDTIEIDDPALAHDLGAMKL